MPHEARRNIRDLVLAGLLGAASVASAWCGYQAALWNGAQTQARDQAVRANFQSLRSTSEWHVLTSIDVSTFLSYLTYDARGDRKMAEYIRTHARPEFRSALDGWIAERQAGHELRDLPFNSTGYQLEAAAKAAAMNREAQAVTMTANKATENADLFVLHTVMFAMALFFLGIASVAYHRVVRLVMSAIGAVAFILSTLSMVGLPRAPSVPRSDPQQPRSSR